MALFSIKGFSRAILGSKIALCEFLTLEVLPAAISINLIYNCNQLSLQIEIKFGTLLLMNYSV